MKRIGWAGFCTWELSVFNILLADFCLLWHRLLCLFISIIFIHWISWFFWWRSFFVFFSWLLMSCETFHTKSRLLEPVQVFHAYGFRWYYHTIWAGAAGTPGMWVIRIGGRSRLPKWGDKPSQLLKLVSLQFMWWWIRSVACNLENSSQGASVSHCFDPSRKRLLCLYFTPLYTF